MTGRAETVSAVVVEMDWFPVYHLLCTCETDTFLKSTDGKVEFSLDNSTYTTTLAVPPAALSILLVGVQIFVMHQW